MQKYGLPVPGGRRNYPASPRRAILYLIVTNASLLAAAPLIIRCGSDRARARVRRLDGKAFLPRWPQAAGKGVDPLGYYLAPWAYADLQVLGEAVEQTKSLDQDKIADYIRSHTFETVVGDVAFGEKGEWKKARVLTIQFQGKTWYWSPDLAVATRP